MWVEDVIEDTASRLKWDNGDTVPTKARRRIIRGMRRLLDRFSIDGRKLPVINQLEIIVPRCDNRVGIGPDQALKAFSVPNTIYHAAWMHQAGCGCDNTCSCEAHSTSIGYALCEEKIRVYSNDDHRWFETHPCRNVMAGRPTELYYQKNSGEVVFNSRPFAGDKLLLRASMPFDVRIFDECSKTLPCYDETCEWEFEICPSHLFDHATRESILAEARDKFDGCPDWSMCTRAQPCDPCDCPIEVTVTARKCLDLNQPKIEFDGDPLPAGYYDSMVRILTWDLAPEAGVKRNADMRRDRDEAVKLLHRSNTRAVPEERDLTTYWGHVDVCDDGPPPSWGTMPRGGCC